VVAILVSGAGFMSLAAENVRIRDEGYLPPAPNHRGSFIWLEVSI